MGIKAEVRCFKILKKLESNGHRVLAGLGTHHEQRAGFESMQDQLSELCTPMAAEPRRIHSFLK